MNLGDIDIIIVINAY